MRSFQRAVDAIRPLKFSVDKNRYAAGSCLVEWGHTHVLCTVSVEARVPSWRNPETEGWLTAEYAMLPSATHTRGRREREKVSGRTQEIQRLIGRSLRAGVDLSKAPGFTFAIDCDVLQADGGTRTASINGAWVALALACQKLEASGKIQMGFLREQVCAVSLGLLGDQILTDLDYDEDSIADTDSNLVMLGSGRFVEVQATAEGEAISEEKLFDLLKRGKAACQQIFELQKHALQA